MIDNLSILYIEDDPELLQNISLLLSTFVPIVHTAKDGKEALEVYFKYSPDILVTDISLPKMDGLTVIEKIRLSNTNIPIVIISAHDEKRYLHKALDANVTSFLPKPFTLDTLKKTINKAINKTHLLKQEQHRVEQLSLINDNVIMLNTNSRAIITQVTDAMVNLSGYSREELIGSPASIVRHEDTALQIYENLWKTIKSGNIWSGELKNRRKDNQEYWVAISITPLFDDNSKIKGFTSIQTNTTEHIKAKEAANKDPLTALYNRSLFNKIITDAINISKRYNTYLSFLMIDIDYFKEFNDTYGHQNGDSALKEIAIILQKHTNRMDDHAFRIGGEEFSILVIGLNEETSLTYANSIRKDILGLNIKHSHNTAHDNLSISIGLYVAKGGAVQNQKNIYTTADKALYKSKKSGRNMVTLSY